MEMYERTVEHRLGQVQSRDAKEIPENAPSRYTQSLYLFLYDCCIDRCTGYCTGRCTFYRSLYDLRRDVISENAIRGKRKKMSAVVSTRSVTSCRILA
jgi:hypothetical protein